MFAGMALGAFVWGFIADIHGRLYVFHRSLLVAGIAGLFVGLTPNFGLSCLLVAGNRERERERERSRVHD